MGKEVVKVRTSITINPNLLAEVRRVTNTNVSQFIEEACELLLAKTKTEEGKVHDE